MQNGSIDNDEITSVEKILLGNSHTFNSEHRAFIQRWDNLAVQACPGSGKTTSLLAKLLILDKRLPFDDNSGILVLSHTNVAVDEIKVRIGAHSTSIFSYPNFVGTFQEFTDRFLALPFARSAMKWQITSIDDELYREALLRKYRAVRWLDDYGKLGSWMWRMYMKEAQSETSNGQDAKRQADKKGEDKIASCYLDLTDNIIKQCPSAKTVAKDPNTERYKGLKKILDEVHEQGVIPFHYAYILALKYIQEHPGILELLQKRFKYIFIDEMQDMDSIQYRLIKELFGASSSVVQYIGDNNQAIYSQADGMSIWQPGNEPLRINGTMRLSQPIATAVESLGIEPQGMQALVQRSDIKPKILVFDDATIGDVIPRFGELVYSHDIYTISKLTGKPIKIVGWRTEADDDPKHLCLSQYSPTYKKKSRSAEALTTLESFMKAVPPGNQNGKVTSKLLMQSLARLLRLSDIKDEYEKPYTPSSLLAMLTASKPDLHHGVISNINTFSQAIARGEKTDAFTDWSRFVATEFCQTLEIEVDDEQTANPEVINFLQSTSDNTTDTTNEPSDNQELKENVYSHIINDESVFTAELCTVHSVKGETHTATLYLECYCYGKHDSERIINILIGDRADASKAQTKMNMKMAYVGMTRATDFLCFAVHRDRVTDEQLAALATNWDIELIVSESAPSPESPEIPLVEQELTPLT